MDVKREMWNRFIMAGLPTVNSLKVKIISISGEEIICDQAKGIVEGEYDCGKQFSTNYFFDLYSKKVIKENKKSECCKKPSLLNDITSCNVDTSYNSSSKIKPFLFFILILYLL